MPSKYACITARTADSSCACVCAAACALTPDTALSSSAVVIVYRMNSSGWVRAQHGTHDRGAQSSRGKRGGGRDERHCSNHFRKSESESETETETEPVTGNRNW